MKKTIRYARCRALRNLRYGNGAHMHSYEHTNTGRAGGYTVRAGVVAAA